ncbi:MAG: BNR/Asp-box repeat protein, partial [Bacteroidetes bacterium]|nr:BNR/Asp-box repeat protein [Bacteroidota bacterium]
MVCLNDREEFATVRHFLVLLAVWCGTGGILYAQVRNVRVSAPGAEGPNEVSIAINPRNPLQLAAGSNLRYFYRSSDGGATWVQSLLPRGTWGDPCVAFDRDGVLLYAHLANLPAPGYFIDRLIVHRSTDGGETWVDSVEVGYRPPRAQQDKEWLAADMTPSPFQGSIYVTWTEFDRYGSAAAGDSSRILFARSIDRGATWSAPLR